MIRLRQVALVAHDLEPVVADLCAELDLTVCLRDPAMTEFGLRNAVMVIGDQFLEVVAPERDGTTAGRLLAKRDGDGGYMAVYEVDDLDHRVEHLTDQDVRVVWGIDLPTIRSRHLHPRDVGGALVSIEQPVPNGSWTWAGPDWSAHPTSAVTGIAGVTVAVDDPAATRTRWAALGLDVSVRFVEAGPRGEGIDGIELVARDRDRAGRRLWVGGVDLALV